jgi:putative ABC transport system ATP-binding protein
MAETSPLISVTALRKHFVLGGQEIRALSGVELGIRRGEFVAIMGPSGSGKSTLLNLLGGLDRPTSGQIVVDGVDITAFDQDALCHYRQHTVGFIFQAFNLLATMSACENVEFPLIFGGVAPAERRRRAQARLTAVGLGLRLKHKPTELSGGEQQRVAIARALVHDPEILLADEPTGNLDSHTGAEVMEVLAQVNREGRTVVMVTHDERVAARAHRTIRMMDGVVVSAALATPVAS